MSGYSVNAGENHGKGTGSEHGQNLCGHGYLTVTPWQYTGNKTLVSWKCSHNSSDVSPVHYLSLTLVSC